MKKISMKASEKLEELREKYVGRAVKTGVRMILPGERAKVNHRIISSIGVVPMENDEDVYGVAAWFDDNGILFNEPIAFYKGRDKDVQAVENLGERLANLELRKLKVDFYTDSDVPGYGQAECVVTNSVMGVSDEEIIKAVDEKFEEIAKARIRELKDEMRKYLPQEAMIVIK